MILSAEQKTKSAWGCHYLLKLHIKLHDPALTQALNWGRKVILQSRSDSCKLEPVNLNEGEYQKSI